MANNRYTPASAKPKNGAGFFTAAAARNPATREIINKLIPMLLTCMLFDFMMSSPMRLRAKRHANPAMAVATPMAMPLSSQLTMLLIGLQLLHQVPDGETGAPGPRHEFGHQLRQPPLLLHF